MSWVRFRDQVPSKTGKTSVWQVTTAETAASRLGEVRWFGRWRCYAFYPAPGILFEKDCLRDIAAFCDGETQKLRLLNRAQRFAQRNQQEGP